MARKNKLKNTKYPSIKELEMADSSKNYIAIFSHNGTRYGERNLTKLFGVRTAKQAFEKLQDIKSELSQGNDVFGSKSEKVDELVYKYLATRSDEYKKTSTYAYDKHIKPTIGHLFINNVTKNHLITIKNNMEKLGLSPSTIKKAKTILTPVFKEALADDVIRKNVLDQVSMGGHTKKPKLSTRIDEPLIDAIRKIYKIAKKQKNDYNAMFLISVMCARRFGEILQIKYEDIIDGVVHVRASTAKTHKKLDPDDIPEKYPLPKEVIDIIGTGTGKVFKYYERTYSDRYAEMIDKFSGIKFKPLSKKYPIRTHDNRNFLLSIQSKDFGKDYVDSVCLGHSNKANMSDVYFSEDFDGVIEVYENYWKKLRGRCDS